MKYFIAILLLPFFLVACDREEVSGIPYAAVNYTLYDRDIRALSSPSSSLVVTKPRLATDRIGFGGLLVVHGLEGYYAFDLACPVEARSNIKLALDNSGTKACCAHCGAEFDILSSDGFPIKNTHFKLVRYYVVLSNYNSGLVSNSAY